MGFPTSQLELLPREIRDMIWAYCVSSPTGYLEPIDCQTGRRAKADIASYGLTFDADKFNTSNSWHGLAIASPHSVQIKGVLTQRLKKGEKSGHKFHPNYFITLSLLRTSKLIRREVEPFFWKNNTFLLSPQILRSEHSGFEMFNKATSIALQIPFPDEGTQFDYAIDLMAKRTNTETWDSETSSNPPPSPLKNLEIFMSLDALPIIKHWRDTHRPTYEASKEHLAKSEMLDPSVKKTMVVQGTGSVKEEEFEEFLFVCRGMYRAFGRGSFFWKTKKVWEEGAKRVGFLKVGKHT